MQLKRPFQDIMTTTLALLITKEATIKEATTKEGMPQPTARPRFQLGWTLAAVPTIHSAIKLNS